MNEPGGRGSVYDGGGIASENHPTWAFVSLGEAAPIDTRPVLPTDQPETEFNYIALENIEAGTGRLVELRPVLGAMVRSNKFVFDASHVLLGKLRPYLNKVVVPNRPGICSTDILPLLPNEDRLCREWLAACLRSTDFIEYSRAKMDGAKMPRLRTPDLERFEIPIPPLTEQRRLVARIEALTSRAQELRALNALLVEDANRLLAAEYSRISRGAPTLRLGDVAKLVRRRVATRPEELYHETGIRSFGKGTFHKLAQTGRQLGDKRVFRIHPGDLVFMNVFAWEGAIAVAKPEDDGRVASHRFMMHEVDPAQATAEFLCYHLLTQHGLEHIRAASPGSAGRNRTLGIAKLHAIPVPVPAVEAQRRFSKFNTLCDKLRCLQTETEAELAAFTPALLAKAFRGEL